MEIHVVRKLSVWFMNLKSARKVTNLTDCFTTTQGKCRPVMDYLFTMSISGK